MSVSAEVPLAPDPNGPPGSSASGDGRDGRKPRPQPTRPLVVTGGIAACAAAASGLAVLVTLTAIGWITAPHVGIGTGLGGVLRTAAMLWLVAHHVGFTVRGAGRIGLLPLGLVLLPGALLAMAGRWVVRAGAVTRLRHVGYAAIALALPYALLAGALAVASGTAVAAPSLLQAVIAAFLLALVAGGLGGARGLAPWSRLGSLMPARPRSIVMGMLGSAAILAAAGAVLAGASLAVHLPEVKAASDALAPGVGGAALLLLAQLAYIPNAIIWAVAYTLGPGFAFGTGTVVAPTGSALGAVPLFPMLAAMPAGARPGGPGWVPVAVLALPYLAGVFAGVVTVRIAPTPVIEAAPLWGFAAGTAAGLLAGLAAAFAGGPLGNGRLASVGPSGFQVGLVAILELGITAALSAAGANWLILRRAQKRFREAARQVRSHHRRARSFPPASATRQTTPTGTGSTSTPGPPPTRTGNRPFCSTLISLPTDLVNWSWHTCCAVTVFAPLMQLKYVFSCGQNTASTSSHSALNARPRQPSTTPPTAQRGRAVPLRRAFLLAVTPSQIAAAANSRVRTATRMPRRRLPSPSTSPIRLSTPSSSAVSARCRTGGSGGGSCGRPGSIPLGCDPRPPCG